MLESSDVRFVLGASGRFAELYRLGFDVSEPLRLAVVHLGKVIIMPFLFFRLNTAPLQRRLQTNKRI